MQHEPESPNILYDDTHLYRAVKTDEPASWLDQDELCWQAQYYDESSLNDVPWERGSYYETPEEAITGAKEAKRNADILSQLFN